VLIREADPEDVNPWGIKFLRMFDMSNDSHLFHTRSQLAQAGYTLDGNRFVREVASDTGVYRNVFLPLYEAKLIHQFDHRWATYDGDSVRDLTDAEKQDPFCVPLPRYWVAEEEVSGQIGSTPYMLAFRDIARSTDERTGLFSIVPRNGSGNTLIFIQCDSQIGIAQKLCFIGNLNSLIADYQTRQKVPGTHLTYNFVKQFPVLPPDFYTPALFDYIVPRVLELTYTTWDLQPFAHDLGYDGEPFTWDVDRRFQLRCELDALYFHLYGIAREDVAYIMDTFPIVKRKDLAEYGTYRTKEAILAVYDDLVANNV